MSYAYQSPIHILVHCSWQWFDNKSPNMNDFEFTEIPRFLNLEEVDS